jgi:hypothetical protein
VERKLNNNYWSLQAHNSTQSTIDATKTTNLSFFAFELPFLYSSYNILFPFSIECLQRPWPTHCLLPHNTQTNKVSYLNSQVFSKQSSQPLTNNDSIKSVVCMKKVDNDWKQKKLNPKTKYCSHERYATNFLSNHICDPSIP